MNAPSMGQLTYSQIIVYTGRGLDEIEPVALPRMPSFHPDDNEVPDVLYKPRLVAVNWAQVLIDKPSRMR